MNKRLDIHLVIQPSCKLVAIDNSDYSSIGIDLLNHVMLEFLSYGEETNPIPESIRLRKEIHNQDYYLARFSSEFKLPADGTYYYYKLLIPILDHFKLPDGKYGNLYEELFFYNNTLYKSKLPNSETTYDLSYVLNNSEKIGNYINAYDIVQNGGASQTFYCPKEIIFSVCKLQKCLVSLQEKLLFTNSCTCSYDQCNTDKTLRNHRDFLLSALYVFDYLKDTQNYTEAQRILDNLSSCNSICGDELDERNNSCGCGNLI